MKKLFTVFISFMLILNLGNLSAQTGKNMPQSQTKRAVVSDISNGLRPMANAEDLVKGPTSDVYLTQESNGNVYKSTVSNPFPGTQIGSAGRSIQCTEYVNGTIYAIDYSSGNRLGTINMSTGAWTSISSTSIDGVSLCFNPNDGLTYATGWDDNHTSAPFGTVNLSTGAFTQIGTLAGTVYMAIDNDGVAYGVYNTQNVFGTFNLSTGAFTQIGTLPFTVAYISNLSVDRETNEIYWAAKSSSADPTFYKIDKATGALTQVATAPGYNPESMCIITEVGEMCDPITNLNVNVSGSNVALTWTAAPGSPTGYEILFNGTTLTTVTATSYTHTNVPDGSHSYCVKALFSGSCIPSSVCTDNVMVGDMCYINFEMFDDYGDGWNGSTITVSVDGTSYGTVTLGSGTYGTQSVLIPAGDVSFTWYSGSSWDYEIWFTVTDAWDIEIYSCGLGDAPANGVFHTYTNTCTAPETATITGTITKNTGGAAIESASVAYTGGPVPSTEYTDASGNYSIDAIVGYSYNVTISANGYNTITETYTPVSGGATKNYQMTAPSISVAPTEVDETTSYMVDAHATVTITNGGDGPLTWSFVPEYQDKAEETVSYLLMDQDIYSAPLNDINSATYIASGSSFPGFMGVGDYFEGVWYLSNVEAAGIYKVDPTNGAVSQVCTPSVLVNGMCAYAGEMYVINSASQTIYTLNLTTGATTQVCAVTGMYAGGLVSGMAIDNSGRCFVLVLNDETIYEVNLSTGVATPAVVATFNANYGQDIAIDREDNQVYWAAFNATSGQGELYKVNVDEGTLTLLGSSSAQLNALAIPTTSGWLSAEPASGEIAAGGTQTVEFTMDGWWAEEGTFYADAIFKSSNPNVGEAIVDVTFTIAAPDCDAPTNLVATVEDYNNVRLSWTAPDGGKGGSKEVILSEDFEGFPTGTSGLPSGWLNIDADGDGNAWLGFKNSGSPSVIPGHSGTGFMSSASYLSAALHPDNWLITHQITIGDNSEVKYWVNAQDAAYPAEHYAIYISTTGTNISNFTLLFEETLTAKSSSGYAEDIYTKDIIANKGIRGTNDQGTWYERTIDLSAYSGAVYLAWRHFDCSDEFRINLDDITVTSEEVVPPPEGLTGYNIYYGNDMTPFATVGPTVTNYTDENVAPAGNYCYKVRAVYEDDCISLPTNEACADVTVKKRTVTGTVKNSLNNANIAGANVRFDATNTTNTLANGSYTIDVPLGTYSVVFSAEGYTSYTETGFVVDDNEVLNVTLDPADCNPVTDVAGIHNNVTDRVTLSWTPSGKGSKAAWDRVDYFTTNASGEQGVATDGNYIYTAFWNTAGQFGKYQMDGTFIETFTISGASGIRDLTYDGTYFYGGGGSTTMNVLDFENKVLVSNITTPLNVRHCTYDPNYDEFWVGDWATLARVSKQGSIQANGPTVSSVYGSGYDNVTDGGPYLLLFSQDVDPGNTCQIVVYQYKIGNNSYNTTPIAVLNDLPGLTYVPGAQGNSIAGGAYVAEYNGKVCFFGNVQQSPNVIGIYELGEVPAVIRYDIYREGSLIGTAEPTESEYIDNVASLASGTYEYCVVAVCEEGFESDEACADVIINKSGIDSYSNIKLYPNPANTVVNIEGESIANITVYNSIGQLVAKYENTNVINVSSYSNGVYFINITTFNGTVEKHKVVVAH